MRLMFLTLIAFLRLFFAQCLQKLRLRCFSFEVTGVDKALFISACAAFCHISTLFSKVSRRISVI